MRSRRSPRARCPTCATASSRSSAGSCGRCCSCASIRPRPSRRARGWWETSSANTTRTAMQRSTKPSFVWPKTSPNVIRSSKAKAISATSTATVRRPCATRKLGSRPWPWPFSRASIATRSISVPPTTAANANRSFSRPLSPTSSPTAPRGSPWAWRPPSPRTTPVSSSTRWPGCCPGRPTLLRRRRKNSSASSRAPICRPGA